MQNGEKIKQTMVYPSNHPTNLNEAKGIKAILSECGLCPSSKIRGKCKKCEPSGIGCCLKRILEQESDFQKQKSLVQEVIEAAGHLCIFLPKFHCELNFIEFFWGAVPRNPREHCAYSYDGLRPTLPDALASV